MQVDFRLIEEKTHNATIIDALREPPMINGRHNFADADAVVLFQQIFHPDLYLTDTDPLPEGTPMSGADGQIHPLRQARQMAAFNFAMERTPYKEEFVALFRELQNRLAPRGGPVLPYADLVRRMHDERWAARDGIIPCEFRVRLHDLSARADLNGKLGTTTLYNVSNGRYGILLDEGGGAALAIKPANAERITFGTFEEEPPFSWLESWDDANGDDAAGLVAAIIRGHRLLLKAVETGEVCERVICTWRSWMPIDSTSQPPHPLKVKMAMTAGVSDAAFARLFAHDRASRWTDNCDFRTALGEELGVEWQAVFALEHQVCRQLRTLEMIEAFSEDPGVFIAFAKRSGFDLKQGKQFYTGPAAACPWLAAPPNSWLYE